MKPNYHHLSAHERDQIAVMRLIRWLLFFCLLLFPVRFPMAAQPERPGDSPPSGAVPAVSPEVRLALENLEPQTPLSVPKSRIIVHVKNLRSNNGLVRINLFASAKGFPSKHTLAFKTLSGKITNLSAEVALPDIPHGAYAIGVLHDEDANGKMKTNWLGMPREGVGVSNDAKGFFGSPKFEDANFKLDADSLTLFINLYYP